MTSSVLSTEPEILTEVPESLKRLVHYIVRGFYGVEHSIIIDLLVRNPCMKEDDMIELLKFERKQLRMLMNTLKNDKFIKVRMRVETDSDGRTTRHNYYFINYKIFVNVVKYKLDHMRRKIEMQERDSTSRSSFVCPSCMSTYTDLEAGELLDFMTQTLKCTYCHSEVQEDETAVPVKDARALLSRFNEQMEPIYVLLRECEDIKLSQELLEPEPTDIKTINSRMPGQRSNNPKNTDQAMWSGEMTKNREYGYMENKVTISMADENKPAAMETRPQKERPIWMTESTVDGAVSNLSSKDISQASTSADTAPAKTQEREDIYRTLLVHEKKTSGVQVPTGAASDNESSSSESDMEVTKPTVPVTTAVSDAVEEMESDEDEDAVPMVTIGDMSVPFNEVTEEMVHKMTPVEKEIYIKMGQDIYADMYD